MGYCYDHHGRLVCDRCSAGGGVRKRTCPHKVSGLPYCPAPALCDDCFKLMGGSRGLHARCKAPAAQRQVEDNERKRQLEAGRLERSTAWGDWHEAVPKGMVGVLFRGLGETVARLLPEDGYNAHEYLDEYADAIPWPNAPTIATKQA